MGHEATQTQQHETTAATTQPTVAHADDVGKMSQAHVAKAAAAGHGKHEKRIHDVDFTDKRGHAVTDKGTQNARLSHFGPNDATLSENQKGILDTERIAWSGRGSRIVIIGHASGKEHAEMARLRANAVADYLKGGKKHPVPDENIIDVEAAGETSPVTDEQTAKDKGEAQADNRSVEIKMITAQEYLDGTFDVAANGLAKDASENAGKGAPERHDEKDDHHADIAMEVIADLLGPENPLGFAAAFAGPVGFMLDFVNAMEEGHANQLRRAFADAMSLAATNAWGIAAQKGRVEYKDVEASSHPRIDRFERFAEYEKGEMEIMQSQGIAAGVAPYNEAMVRTEKLVRQKLEHKGHSGAKLTAIYNKIVRDVRSDIAAKLNEALQAEAKKLRRH